MSSIQERLQLKRVPLDTWNVREQLCLASAVVRSGDQNWMSVSRALKTCGEPNRPPDWYSQKSCAAQYGALLEHVETPKRKKRSSEGAVETPQESILKRLTQDRILEIQKTLADMNQQYDQLKTEIAEAHNPATSEERLQELWVGMENAKRAREREHAKRAAWLKEREDRRARAERTWRPTQTTASSVPASQPAPSSPLLTSLLKSSPVVTTPQHMPHPATVVETVSPSAGAPTLSMLLEKAGSTSPHESKHAAIEHIKSQLVQIEQQLKAGTTSSQAVPLAPAPAPAVDIDDIEIKAEDVYAFRDIDLHIPPVATMHKCAPRPAEKVRKDEPPPEIVPELETMEVEELKVEPPSTEVVAEEEVANEIEMTEEVPHGEHSPKPATRPATPEAAKVAFPEVKFPTPEIKVIQPECTKIREDLKELREGSEPAPEERPEKQNEAEVEKEVPEADDNAVASVEDDSILERTETIQIKIEELSQDGDSSRQVEEDKEESVGEETVIVEETSSEPVEDTQTDVMETEESQTATESDYVVAEESNVSTTQEELTEGKDTEGDSADEKLLEDIKKEEDAEDSIPLKEMMKEESLLTTQQVKEEKPEVEDTHTETDDDTPMELSREEEKDGKKKRDYSRKKKSDSRNRSGSESAEASAPESPSGSDMERQHRLWRKSVMLVYSRLCAHKYASLFLRPISDEEAPGYSSAVKRPMDLSAIRRNIDTGVVRTTAEFQRDVLLMLSNALMYNSSEHSVYTMAKEMFEEAQGQLGMLLAAQAHAGLCCAPPRRKRRAPERH